GERVAVTRVFPGVAGHAPGLARAARGEDHGPAAHEQEAPRLAEVREDAGDALAVLEQAQGGALHVEADALVHAVILQRADELEARAVAHVREPRVAMPAEVALADQPVLGPIEDGAPLLELADARGRLLRVQL